MSEILLTPTTKLVTDGKQFMPYFFDEGGKDTRIVGTNEMTTTKPGWKHTGTYHTNLDSAIKELAKIEVLKRDQYQSLKEYLNAFKENVELLLNSVKQ
jgi:hypothetical protein